MYLDSGDQARLAHKLAEDQPLDAPAGTSTMQLATRNVYEEWGVPCAEAKAIVESTEILTVGAATRGHGQRVLPPPAKAGR